MEIKPSIKKAQALADREKYKEQLRALFAEDSKPVVKTILRHVSQSGMSRNISVVYKGEDITWKVAKALGEPIKEKHGSWIITMGGCGMDMGFSLVYNLATVLYGYENQGGYRLKQEWL